MMTRKITFLALIVGIVLGAAATACFNVYRQAHGSQSFQQRVHCKAVADAYVKEHTDLADNSDTGTSVTVDRVDYSPARNSCVAEVETTTYFRGGFVTFESVQDLLSGDALFTVSESQIGSGPSAKRTGLDLDTVRLIFLPRVWDYVLRNADKPDAIGKEYIQMEKDLAPKTIAPASSVAEPKDWQAVPATEYDAHGKPIGPQQQKIHINPNTGERIP